MTAIAAQNSPAPLVDSFGRTVTYLRLSVTDRCDLRCTYCMAEKMTFLPKSDLLDAAELEAVARAFIARGVTKIRVTGGEPLVRRNIMDIMSRLSRWKFVTSFRRDCSRAISWSEDQAECGRVETG